MTSPGRIAVIGYGHPDRGDDGAGPAVARRLRGLLPPEVEIREVMGDGTALMEAWSGFARVVVVDTLVSGAPAGTLHRIDGRRFTASEEFRGFSSHALGLREAIRLAQALDRLPPEIEILGIEGRRFGPGDPVGPEVRMGIERAVALLLADFQERASPSGSPEGAS
jgi:hydrogenase maturation protease